jgi:hypothetical protein
MGSTGCTDIDVQADKAITVIEQTRQRMVISLQH